jgi:hypothetical protein
MEQMTDVTLPGVTLPWSHSRSYSSAVAGNTIDNYAWVSGYKWYGTTEFMMRGTDSAPVLYVNAHSSRTFGASPTYTPPDDFRATLSHDTTNHLYVLTMTDSGMVYKFYDFTGNWTSRQQGLLSSTTDRYGSASITYTYSASNGGRLAQATTSQGWTVTYTYINNGTNSGRLQKIDVSNGSAQVIKGSEIEAAQARARAGQGQTGH